MSNYSRTLASVCLFTVLMCSGLAAQSQDGRRFAFLVGINQYADPGFVPLQKAQNDADDLGKALTRLGGWKVTVMSGGVAYSDINFPSKAKITERLTTLAEIARQEDQVLVFFSGHGVNDKDGASYLLPIDAKVSDAIGTDINVQSEIIDTFAAKGINNVVILVDACQKTVVKDKGLSVIGVNAVKPSASAVVITATSQGKASFEDPQGPNGLFTRGLLTGLNGDADKNRDGAVSVAELERYLPDAVSEYAFSVGINQKPAVFDTGTGMLQPALVRYGAAAPAAPSAAGPNTGEAPAAAVSGKAQYVTFKLPDGVRVDLKVLDQDGREVKSWTDTGNLSEKLEPGSYKVVAQDRNYLYYQYTGPLVVGDTKVNLSLDLKPNFGRLLIVADPAEGVDILINGKPLYGLSKGQLVVNQLKSGNYDLVFSKDQFETKKLTVTVQDGKTAEVNVNLSTNAYTLQVKAVPGLPATLWVDGKSRGALPQSLSLPFKDTQVRVVPEDPRYREWASTVRPAIKGSTESVSPEFAPRTGTLEVLTDPDMEAVITLKPAKGEAKAIGSCPVEYQALMGDYELSAVYKQDGYDMVGSARVSVTEGQTSQVRIKLKDLAPPPKKDAKGVTILTTAQRRDAITKLRVQQTAAQQRLDGIDGALKINDAIGWSTFIGGLLGVGVGAFGLIHGSYEYGVYKASTDQAAVSAARTWAEVDSNLLIIGPSAGGGLLGVSLINLIARPDAAAIKKEINECERQIQLLEAQQ